MTVETKKWVEIARKLGAEAFAKGLSSIPIHDPKLYALLKEISEKDHSMGAFIPPLEAWTKAWEKANLAAPLPDL